MGLTSDTTVTSERVRTPGDTRCFTVAAVAKSRDISAVARVCAVATGTTAGAHNHGQLRRRRSCHSLGVVAAATRTTRAHVFTSATATADNEDIDTLNTRGERGDLAANRLGDTQIRKATSSCRCCRACAVINRDCSR